jgi:preprotein translocase subunit SecG
MLQVLYFIHVLICIGLIIVVLLQTGKGAGLASVFGTGGGGGGSGGDSLFGSKGFGGVLAKATAVLAVAFMVSSISLSLIPLGRSRAQDSVLDRLEGPAAGAPQGQQAPQPAQMPTEQVPTETDAPAETPGEQPAETPTSGQ